MTDPMYFRDMYAASPDPWNLAERSYEHRKFELSVASLPSAHYRNAFEPGCSIGMLTQLLAPRCDAILATDPAAPLEDARRRVPDPSVRFEQASVPADWPDETFDLIVLSELLYFLDAAQRAEVLRRSLGSLEPGGHLLLVHWRHEFEVAACTGDDVHREFSDHAGLTTVVSHLEDDFRLEVYAHVAP